MKNKKDYSKEPAWQEPMEWMCIGALLMEIFMICIM